MKIRRILLTIKNRVDEKNHQHFFYPLRIFVFLGIGASENGIKVLFCQENGTGMSGQCIEDIPGTQQSRFTSLI